MTRDEIDAAIKRHADFELLYDKPYEDTKKVRVAGPVHGRVAEPAPLACRSGGPATEPSRRETEAAKDADAPNFEQSILDNLAKAGIQNGRRQERIKFAAFETYAGDYIQAIGERVRRRRAATRRRGSAIAIGPQYGTVSPSYVKKAAREAINAEDVDLLCILGFAFDPQVTGVTEDDGVTVEASDEGFASVAGVTQARPHPGADGADERRPADGRGAQEDRRRQPVHRLRRARHRHRRDRRTASSSTSRASTSTTRRPARCAATTPARSRCG